MTDMEEERKIQNCDRRIWVEDKT